MSATMTLYRLVALAAAVGLLVGAAPRQHAMAKSPHAPQPGYKCEIERRGSFGVIKSHFAVPDIGQMNSGYVAWDAGNGQYQNPWFTAAFYRKPGGGYSLGNGYGAVMWHIWEARPGRKPKSLDLALELTANPTPMPVASRLAGKLERSGGPFHLQFDWLDAAALGRGAPSLFLIARNKRREAVRQMAIDGTMFVRAEPVLLETFAEVERMIVDPRRRCTRVEDLGTDEIVVT